MNGRAIKFVRKYHQNILEASGLTPRDSVYFTMTKDKKTGRPKPYEHRQRDAVRMAKEVWNRMSPDEKTRLRRRINGKKEIKI